MFILLSLCVVLSLGASLRPQWEQEAPPRGNLRASIFALPQQPVAEEQHQQPYVPRSSVGKPWGKAKGLLQFRGNPTHSYYGSGEVSWNPKMRWKFPKEGKMCSQSTVGNRPPKTWCGSGWTGQPSVWEHDGVEEVIFGAYDRKIHFLNGKTGEPTRKAFETGDIIKGSVSVDPDGFPLVYSGSRDNYFRILAVDRDGGDPEEIWKLSAYKGVIKRWNDDWDGNPSIVGDYLFEGGENSWVYVFKLNRGYDANGKVTVDPKRVAAFPVWVDDLQRKGSPTSVENSIAIYEDTMYSATGQGMVYGYNISGIENTPTTDFKWGRRSAKAQIPPKVFEYWAGDDIDASIVIDREGMLYVSVEYEFTDGRNQERAAEVGQLIKLDPSKSGDEARVWGVKLLKRDRHKNAGGLWSTPALGDTHLFVTTHIGELLSVRLSDGAVDFREDIGWHAWSSPALLGNRLLVPTCSPGGFRTYDVTNESQPKVMGVYKLPSGGCIESTPAVWNGKIYVGSRDGRFYSFE